MYTVDAVSEGHYKDRGSRFIALLYPAYSVEEVNRLNQELRDKYRDARHVCFAYKIDNLIRENDDGEPGHSAGSPIMRQILSARLNKVVIFVIRYFGGTKLGVPGLIEAYGTSAGEAIKNAILIEYIEKRTIILEFAYPSTNHIKYLINKHNIEQIHSEYLDTCKITCKIPRSEEIKIRDSFENYLISWTTPEEID